MANKSATSWQQVAVMENGKRHDTTDTTDFLPRQLVTDLSFMLRTCYGESGVMDFGFYTTEDDYKNERTEKWNIIVCCKRFARGIAEAITTTLALDLNTLVQGRHLLRETSDHPPTNRTVRGHQGDTW